MKPETVEDRVAHTPGPWRLPKLARNHKRAWRRCRSCGAVAYYDYVPFSFSNPIACMPCGHGLTERDMGADHIEEAEALAALTKASVR